MPKMKTKKLGLKKDSALQEQENLKETMLFKSHILTKKGNKQKRNLTKTGLVHESDMNNIKHQLGL